MATATVTERDIERAIAERDLLSFLDYVWIPDASPSGPGKVKYILWPHLLRLHREAEAVGPGESLPVLKARKIGVTSYFEARFVWLAMYHSGAFLPVISQGETEARKVISDCKFIHAHLPPHIQVPRIGDNADVVQFQGGGIIQAFPATSKATRSYTGTEILFDEADFHEYFRTAYDATLPLIHDTGGKMFVPSTANPEKADSEFRQVYLRSKRRLFLGYFERPGRSEETYKAGLALASDPANYEKENPRNETEALSPPKASAYFDVEAMTAMDADITDPREQLRGVLSIWQRSVVAGKYVMGADTAWGRTGSYNCAAVLDWATGVQMAELHGRLHPDDMAQECFDLHRMYNHAYMGPEIAGEGQERDGESVVVVNKLVELLKGCSCYDRLYYHDHESKTPIVPGWRTDSRSRPVMLGEFAEAVRNRLVVIRCRQGLDEMLSFIRNKEGRPEAAQGAHDDRVMALALGWQMRKYARYSIGSGTRKPYFVKRG